MQEARNVRWQWGRLGNVKRCRRRTQVGIRINLCVQGREGLSSPTPIGPIVTSTQPDSRASSLTDDALQWTRLEVAFTAGIVGCLLFATWQLGDLLARDWLAGWVGESELREDLVYYGVAFTAALAALGGTTRSLAHAGRFRRTVGRSLLWYGALLLISASGMGAIEYLPEVAAGLFGAGVLIAAVYVLQQRYFTRERIRRRRLRNDNCPQCGSDLRPEAHHCSQCGRRVGEDCPECGGYLGRSDRYCADCGRERAEGAP
mgnify:FL=1